MDPHLDFGEISAFLGVVEAGNYTRAAEVTGTSKSSLSRRVARLEGRLGVRLLARTTRSLRLTEEGAAFHARVAVAMAGVQDAARDITALRDTPSGHLKVTGPSDLVAADLGGLAAAFTARYPEISIEMVLTQRTVDLIAEGFDVALRAGQLPDSSLTARRVGTGRIRLFAAPDYLRAHGTPATAAALREHECLLFRVSGRKQRWTLEGPDGPTEVEVRGRLASNDFGLLRDAACAGAGIAFMPGPIAQPEVRAERLVPVLPELAGPASELNIIYPGGRLLSAKVRVFRDFAVEWISKTVLD